MIGFPSPNAAKRFAFLQDQLRDEQSVSAPSPIGYMFKDDPNRVQEAEEDPVAVTLREMDRFGVAIGLVGLAGAVVDRALDAHPDRFKANLEAKGVALTIDVMNFLSGWLNKHILYTDKKYSTFFNAKGLEQALRGAAATQQKMPS